MSGPIPALAAGFNPLPGRPVSQEVPVLGALSRLPELRSAVRVCEWMVEPLAGSDGLTLTFVLSENVSLSFLLAQEDAQDLAQALSGAGVRGRSAASGA